MGRRRRVDSAVLRGVEPIPAEFAALIWRRVVPYLDSVGMSKSLEHLMSEAYLQGARDTLQVLEKYLPERLGNGDRGS